MKGREREMPREQWLAMWGEAVLADRRLKSVTVAEKKNRFKKK